MICVKNITKRYGNFVAVDNISFTINDGEIVGLLGPNGAGKSTTMNMITGYIEQTEGTITVNNFDTIKQAKKAKKCIGYMPENVPLYTDMTVKEFVSYMAELKGVPKKERKDNIIKTLKDTGLFEVQNKLIKNLSRGFKQRVSMAGALVSNPSVLILDEPTVGLDPKQITEIRALIKSLGKEHTLIISSHILSEISQLCEKVIIINNGKIIAEDTPKNLEEKSKDNSAILVTVEDKNNKMENILEICNFISDSKLVKDNEDGTKQYLITSKDNNDIRKLIFETFAKESITIFELKKDESTLEDAFIKLVDSSNNSVNSEDTHSKNKTKKGGKK